MFTGNLDPITIAKAQLGRCSGTGQHRIKVGAEQLAKVSEYTAALDLVEGKATAHICKGASCRESTTDVASMLKQILVKK